jgi:hypothetical protein
MSLTVISVSSACRLPYHLDSDLMVLFAFLNLILKKYSSGEGPGHNELANIP